MATCIKCGREIPDGELFCAECGLNGGVPSPRPLPKAVGKMQTPVSRPPRVHRAQPEVSAAPLRQKKSARRACAVLALCCVLLAAAGSLVYLTGSAKLRAQQEEITLLQEQNAFYDRYAVCVNNDGSGLYHRYDCARFTPQNFWIYSRGLAEANGFLPCPDCMEP